MIYYALINHCSMREKIRKLLLSTDTSVVTSTEQFVKWLFTVRKQENLFYKSSIEAPEEYEYSENFIKELFWQITCWMYLQSLKMPATDENLNSVESLIRKYNDIASIETLMPSLKVDIKELNLSAWDTSRKVDTLVNGLDSFCDSNKDTQNFLYLLRHLTGHDIRPAIRRFASNLSSDLKN